MERGAFAINVTRNGVQQFEMVEGYLFDRGAFRFGAHKVGRCWTVTEISTGLAVNVTATRLKDLPELVDCVLEACHKVLDRPDPRIEHYREQVREFYRAS